MPAVAPIGVLCVFLACMLMSYAYEHTFHVLLSHVAGVFIRATWNGPLGISIGFAFLGDAINKLDSLIRDGLYAGMQGTEWAWHQTVHQTAVAWHDLAHTVEQVSLGTLGALHYLRHSVMPEAIRLAVSPVGEALRLVQAQLQPLLRQVGDLSRPLTKTIYHDVPHALTRAEEASIAALVQVPAAITRVIEVPATGIDYVGREAKALRDRLDSLAHKLSPAVIVGVVAASVLGTLGLGWVKCSNVGKVGRSVCGMSRGLLDALLLGLTAIFGTLGLLSMARGVQDITADATTFVLWFWRAGDPGPGGDRTLGQPGHDAVVGSLGLGSGGDRTLGQSGG